MYKWKKGFFIEAHRKAEKRKGLLSREKYTQAEAYKILNELGGKYNRLARMDDYLEKMDFEICEL